MYRFYIYYIYVFFSFLFFSFLYSFHFIFKLPQGRGARSGSSRASRRSGPAASASSGSRRAGSAPRTIVARAAVALSGSFREDVVLQNGATPFDSEPNLDDLTREPVERLSVERVVQRRHLRSRSSGVVGGGGGRSSRTALSARPRPRRPRAARGVVPPHTPPPLATLHATPRRAARQTASATAS